VILTKLASCDKGLALLLSDSLQFLRLAQTLPGNTVNTGYTEYTSQHIKAKVNGKLQIKIHIIQIYLIVKKYHTKLQLHTYNTIPARPTNAESLKRILRFPWKYLELIPSY
jgi:hypothetical protein